MATAHPNRPSITVINGSLGGSEGNTARFLGDLWSELQGKCRLTHVHLAEDQKSAEELEALLAASDGFVFATGTYWDSWGSPLQKFFEDATDWEASSLWLGKPAAVVVTMHSVGGKGVLSRLQGVLSTWGLLIPPMSGMVYSLANHLALQSGEKEHHADLWQKDDLKRIAHNLLTGCRMERPEWQPWPVDAGDSQRVWLR